MEMKYLMIILFFDLKEILSGCDWRSLFSPIGAVVFVIFRIRSFDHDFSSFPRCFVQGLGFFLEILKEIGEIGRRKAFLLEIYEAFQWKVAADLQENMECHVHGELL